MLSPQATAACLVALFLAAQALAHPSHTSFAEIGWSESGEKLEVALRVIPEDLEELLAARLGRHVTLLDSAPVQAQLSLWLNDEFRVYAGSQPLPVQWVGMDLQGYRASWLFFTITAPRDTALTLQNRVLVRHNSAARQRNQINTVQRLWQPATDRMVFTDEQPQPLWTPRQ